MSLHGVICDGHCLTAPSTGGEDRHEWHKWMNEKVYYMDGEWVSEGEPRGQERHGIGYWRPVMGRAVIWKSRTT